ncbi:MAG: DUF1127 domain-containing protein [Pseudomonadota bacterium]|nr:DUF1127 domain-containing protein [Pseudomonadota bacterium]
MSTLRSMIFAPAHDMAESRGSSEMAAAAHVGRFGRSTLASVRYVLDWVGGAMDRARQRNQLASLDDRLLKDIGLTRCDVMVECRKPFWR